MDWLVGNSFFILLLLICVGMHIFGHGHGHGHGHANRRIDRKHSQGKFVHDSSKRRM